MRAELPRIKVDLFTPGRNHSLLLVVRLLTTIKRNSFISRIELIGLLRLVASNVDGICLLNRLALLAFFTSCLHLASKKTFLQVRTHISVFRNLKQQGQSMGSRPNKNRLTYSDCLNE